jgi:hypothetical protein
LSRNLSEARGQATCAKALRWGVLEEVQQEGQHKVKQLAVPHVLLTVGPGNRLTHHLHLQGEHYCGRHSSLIHNKPLKQESKVTGWREGDIVTPDNSHLRLNDHWIQLLTRGKLLARRGDWSIHP